MRENARYYVDGSAARQLRPQEDKYARRRQTPQTRRAHSHRRVVKAAPMNKGYIAVMAAAFLIVCVVLTGYVKLQ